MHRQTVSAGAGCPPCQPNIAEGRSREVATSGPILLYPSDRPLGAPEALQKLMFIRKPSTAALLTPETPPGFQMYWKDDETVIHPVS